MNFKGISLRKVTVGHTMHDDGGKPHVTNSEGFFSTKIFHAQVFHMMFPQHENNISRTVTSSEHGMMKSTGLNLPCGAEFGMSQLCDL